MTELQRALDQITDIRQYVAEAKLFQGFGPLVIGLTGLLALSLGVLQAGVKMNGLALLQMWVLLGVVSVLLIGSEMWALSRRADGSNAYALLWAIVEKFFPSLFAGAVLGWIMLQYAPQAHWIMPGIWQILISIALFSARTMLPKAVTGVAAWYMVTGLVCLFIASRSETVTPWSMAVPFGFGQLIMALCLKWPFTHVRKQV